MDIGGYYDSYCFSMVCELWFYDDICDVGFVQVVSGGGYLICRQWWVDGSNGLWVWLLGQVDFSLLNCLVGWVGFLSCIEVDDLVVCIIVLL